MDKTAGHPPGLRINTHYTQHVNGSMWSYMPLIPPDLFRRGKERKMPYGLKDEDFDKIQNEIVRKLYEIPSLGRAAFLVECTEQEAKKRWEPVEPHEHI